MRSDAAQDTGPPVGVIGRGGWGYHSYLKNLALAVTGKMDQHFTALWEGGHIKFWSAKTLSSLFDGEGFERIGLYRVGRIPQLAKSMVVVFRDGV
jgi:2-polyprenyl-6-hydroxyphenyl methylase/3-demethylubiquinone-9 3-methyltransferase